MPGSQAWNSLRLRLPLLLTALIATVLAVFLWAADREFQRAALQAGGERALVAASQLASVLAQNASRGLTELQRLAADTSVRQYLLSPNDELRAALQQQLRVLAVSGHPPPVLMTDGGEQAFVVTGSSAASKEMMDLIPRDVPTHRGVGPLRATGGAVFSDVVVEVREMSDDSAAGSAPSRRLGFLVVRRLIQSGQNPDVIARLVGSGATLAVGNRAGEVWTDFSKQVAGPPADAVQGRSPPGRAADGAARLGGLAAIDGTPWVVWIELPRSVILAPARAALARLTLLAVGFVAVAGAFITVLIGRITKPLHDLTQASEAIAAGEYSRRVLANRRDEIGRLGVAFNTMTERVAEAQRGLEERVTERTASLAEATARLDQFFSLSPDMLCIADMKGHFVRVNEAWHEVLGWSAEELTSRPYNDFVHPDDVAVTSAESARLAAGETTMRFENRYRNSDGSYRWLSWRATPILSRGLIYAAARDVTERRRFERELQERAAELAAVNRELEAFSYSVSHDLRAPLRHVSGFVALLQASASPKLNDEECRRLRAIAEAATRMGRLIDDLLAFSRMGRTVVAKRRVSLDDLVREARKELAADPNSQRVAWQVQALPTVDGDPSLLRLVFVNLMSNALKYSRDTPDARIEIGQQTGHSDETVVFVRDNGVGFDMQYADKLFGVFQRLHRADEFEGTGIGLANVRRIIHRHGGRTWAEGAVKAGATFYFSLPMA